MSVATKSSGLSRHTIEEKIEAVRQRIFQESSFRELQERHGICSATLSVWIKKYKAEVLRRFPVKDLPLYVLKYQETMTTEEENELTRLRRENEDLKLLHEANLLMIDMAKERFGIDIKKNYEEMLSGGGLKEVPGVKGNDEKPSCAVTSATASRPTTAGSGLATNWRGSVTFYRSSGTYARTCQTSAG